jgi:CYTH domain-containing protein
MVMGKRNKQRCGLARKVQRREPMRRPWVGEEITGNAKYKKAALLARALAKSDIGR